MSANNRERSFAEKILAHCFKGVKSENIKVESPDTKGDGYLSSLLFVEVNCKNKVFHLVIKVAPQDEEQRDYVNIRDVFLREAYFYTKVYPIMKEHQKQTAVEHGFSSITKCYGTYLEDKNEALVLQDLKKLGYKLWDRKVPMDEYHVTKVLEQYGKLHAASLALRNQNPQQFQSVTECLRGRDILAEIVRKTRTLLTVYDRKFKQVAEMLKFKGYETEAQHISSFRKEIPDVMLNYADQSDVHSVILHGDCWCNNMMFSYEKGNTRPTKMCFLDFQLSRLASPLLDFSYFFYTCADKHILDDIEKYLNIYYNSLSDCLKEYGCNASDLFPYLIFKEHWRKYSKFGLVLSLILFRITLCDKEEAPHFTDQDFSDDFFRPIKNEDSLNERTINVVKHFVDNKLI